MDERPWDPPPNIRRNKKESNMNRFRRHRKVLTLPALLAAGLLTGCGNSDGTEEVHSFAVWEKTDEV